MMENYKKKINVFRLLLVIPILISVILAIYDVFIAPPNIKENFIFGFQLGASSSLGLLAAIIMYRFSIILKDEKQLQLYFNRANDERYKAIRAKAGMPLLLINSCIMLIAAVIGGYFNSIIFFTLTLAAIIQMVICCIVKLIYTKIM